MTVHKKIREGFFLILCYDRQVPLERNSKEQRKNIIIQQYLTIIPLATQEELHQIST